MSAMFLKLLDMSYTASFVILLILLARIPLQKAPKIFSYALWSVALFRLICPWTFESALSLLAIGGRISGNGRHISFFQPYVASETVRSNAILSGSTTGSPSAPGGAAEPLMQDFFTSLWLIGIAGLLICSLAALLRIKKQLRGAAHERANIYIAKRLSTPFVMGVIRPKIYLPEFLSGTEKQYILLHEKTHIRRLDHITKLVSFLVLCVHWFNPLVWLAFFLSDRDREMSCDEAVIRMLGNGIKKEYSSSLLSFAAGRRITVGGAPLAFSETDAKSRIKNILSYKKPSPGMAAAGFLAVAAACFGLLTNPISGSPFSCASTSVQPEFVLTEKMGFPVHFPESLDGEYAFLYTSEGIGIKKPVSSAAWKEMVPDVQKAIDDETAYKDLGEYKPYRLVTGYYRYRGDSEGFIAINMTAKKDSLRNVDAIAETRTKVGDLDARWLETVYPDDIKGADGEYDRSRPQGTEKAFLLTWEARDIQYNLILNDTDITMEEAVKLAESFMAGQ